MPFCIGFVGKFSRSHHVYVDLRCPIATRRKGSAAQGNFATSAALVAAFKKPGRKTDANPTSLQLRVSEKKRAVWYYRFRGPDGQLNEGTLKFLAVPHGGDGKVTLDYEQAKQMVARLKLESRKTEVEKHADSNRAHFHTRLLGGLGMRWDQIDFEQGYYYVLPDQEGWKGFSGVLPLSDFVLELLKRRRGNTLGKGEYVFPAHHGEAYPHRSRMADAMKAVSAEFNFKATAQDLRRTFATVSALCLDDNMRKVGALLTHKWAVSAEGMAVTRDAITRRYVQSTLRQLRAAANLAASFMLELAGKLPMSDRTRAILKENDPENLRLLDLSVGNEERELERLALAKEREVLLRGHATAGVPGEDVAGD